MTIGALWSVKQVFALMKVEGKGGSVRPPSWTIFAQVISGWFHGWFFLGITRERTVLDEVQSYASDDWDFILCHGTEKLLHSHFLICDFCRWVEDVVVFYVDNFGL